MPLTLDSILQQNSGDFDGTSGTVTLLAATTAGSTVVICAMSASDGSAATGLGPPTGFAWASDEIASPFQRTTPYVFWKNTTGGETSWTLDFVTGAGDQCCWSVFELVGLDQAAPVHLASSTNPFDDAVPTTSRSTGTTTAASSYDLLGFAVHPARAQTSTVPTWSAHTNGWTELLQEGRTDGANGVGMSVSAKTSQAPGTHECTATLDASCHTRATVVMFTAQDAQFAVTADVLTGFEFGTTTTLTTTSIAVGNTGPVFDGTVGTPAVTTSTPRTGTYALELAAAAAAECLTWTNPGVLSLYGPFTPASGGPSSWQGPLVGRIHVYFPTSLPGADVELASVEAGSLANGMTIWYRSATQKIGVKIGTGSEIASDAVVVANKWIGIDFRYLATVANHTCDWQVTYDATVGAPTAPVVQTQAVGAGTSVATISTFRLGWTTSKTATVRYDDVMLSKVANNYPIGDIQIHLLKVDPAGTATVVGTTGNFGVMTANGTIGAWNATNARNAIDDVPPTIGASSDGVVQTAVATTEYMKFPMDTRAGAPDDGLRAVRWYFLMWAASGTTAFGPGIRVFDGTTEYNWASGGVDHGVDASTTVAYWLVRMMRPTLGSSAAHYLLTQARLDAMEVRIGFSGDATPDVGVLSAFMELAIQPAVTQPLFGSLASQATDAVSGGIVAVSVDAPAGADTTLYYEESGAPTTVPVTGGTSHTETIDAPDAPTANYIALYPPAEV